MNNVYFTPYRISTITCNADIGNNININLLLLFENITIIENTNNNFIWIQYLKENIDKSRGINPKKKRKNKKEQNKKCRFDNQITAIYKINDIYKPNIKIFKNGNIQFTGIKNTDDVKEIVSKLIYEIKLIYSKNNDLLFDTDINNLNYQNLIIRMINTDFKVFVNKELTNQYLIKRKNLHLLLISDIYNNKCSFQPGIYHGVKLEFFWNTINSVNNGICNCSNHCFGKGNGTSINNCKKITIAIFESGSILITGGVNFNQIDEAYNYICSILKKHEDTVRKINIIAVDS